MKDRSHSTRVGKEELCFQNINGGVAQGSRVGPVAFIVHINKLPQAIKEVLNLRLPCEKQNDDFIIIDDDTILFMDDSTTYEIIDVHSHISDTKIGYTQEKIDAFKSYAENEKMQLNLKKCREMLIDFRRQKTTIPQIKVKDTIIERVTSFKLLGLWVDDNLKWNTNTNHIVRKAVNRLQLLKVLRSYGAPDLMALMTYKDLMAFYTSVIRSVLEYRAQVWHGSLTGEQCYDIERIQKRALRMIYPRITYNKALTRCGIKTLESRRKTKCVNLVKDMMVSTHKLHDLLPLTVNQIQDRETRLNGDKIYNFNRKTERFKKSPIVFAIDK